VDDAGNRIDPVDRSAGGDQPVDDIETPVIGGHH
jgi:hypothetical protein